jgi:predicted ATPase
VVEEASEEVLIRELRLDNFQGFGQQTIVPLKPLTLIYGPNAAGKSSIFRALLLAKQSLPKESLGLLRYSGYDGFVFEGDQISLASFENAVYKHNTGSIMTLGLRLSSSSGPRFARISNLNTVQSISFDWLISKKYPLVEVKITFHLLKSPQEFSLTFKRKNNKLVLSGISGANYLLETLENYQTRRQLRDNEPFEALDDDDEPSFRSSMDTFSVDDFQGLQFPILGNLPRISVTSRDASLELEGPKQRQLEILDDLIILARSCLMQNLAEVVHIKPLRDIDHRFIYEGEDYSTENLNDSVDGNKSEETISDWISNLTEGRYKFKTVKFIAEEMSHLGKMKSQMLIDTVTDTPVSFRDVGVGLSQVKPILEVLSNIDDAKQAILLIEQPELHLHPKMQGDMASLFIDFSANHPETQIIAETHSEAMLLRIQKQLRDGKLNPDDVQILYVDRSWNPDYQGNSVSVVNVSDEDEFDFELPLSFAEIRFQDLI